MKKYLLLLFLFVAAICSNAQMINLGWARQIDASYGIGWDAKHITVDSKKNVYIVSVNKLSVNLNPAGPPFILYAGGWCDAFICKLDSFGNFVWGKAFGGPRFTHVSRVKVDTLGNVYTVGMFSGTSDFDPGPGNYPLTVQGGSPEPYGTYISKLDVNGNFVWAKQIGGNGMHVPEDMLIDEQANVYVTGYTSGITDMDPGPGVINYDTGGGYSAYILKLDTDGAYKYHKAFKGSYSHPYNLRLDKYKNIYLNGTFNGVVDFDPGPGVHHLTEMSNANVSFFVKLDSLGNFIWATKNVQASTFDVDEQQNIYVFTANSSQGWLLKYDSNGNILWNKTVGGGPIYEDENFTIKIDKYNDVYLTGAFTGTKDFDPGPAVYNLTAAGSLNFSDIFVSRLDQNGNFKWAVSFEGYAPDFGNGIDVDDDGNVYGTGRFLWNIDFDPGPGVVNLTTGSGDAIYALKLSPCSNRTYQSLNINACHSYTLNGNTYTKSGTYFQKITNSQGCDSLITLQLAINGFSDTTSVTACDSYSWNGQTYHASGFYRDTLIGTTGCDSILNLDLTIRNGSSSTITRSVCEGQNVEGYTSSGTYTDIFIASNGCDSTRTLHLTVKERKYADIYHTICQGESYLGHSSAGIYKDTLLSSTGCDSIRTLHLAVNKKYVIDINKTICEGEQFLGHSTPGFYIDTLQTFAGCDSIIRTNLEIDLQPRPYLVSDTNICKGSSIVLYPGQFDSYLWQDGSTGRSYTANRAGLYSVTVTNSCGQSDAGIIVKEISCNWNFPNVFTPNKDGKNDVFKILNAYNLENYHLKIFNRYGQLVFETRNYNTGWDGSFRNMSADAGAYVWICTFKENNRTQNLKGTVLLVK